MLINGPAICTTVALAALKIHSELFYDLATSTAASRLLFEDRLSTTKADFLFLDLF